MGPGWGSAGSFFAAPSARVAMRCAIAVGRMPSGDGDAGAGRRRPAPERGPRRRVARREAVVEGVVDERGMPAIGHDVARPLVRRRAVASRDGTGLVGAGTATWVR